MLGVLKVVPVPNELPPEAAAYQFRVPEQSVADIATEPDPQRDPPRAVGAGVAEPITAVTVARGLSQPAAEVQET